MLKSNYKNSKLTYNYIYTIIKKVKEDSIDILKNSRNIYCFLYERKKNMKRKFTRDMVNDYAEKLLIGLTEEENKMVLEEFSVIDETINKINKIKDIDKVEPMTHCLDRYITELRSDEIEDSVPINELLQNCDIHTEKEVELPKVVG